MPVILGTDTDAGKTTLAMLWLGAAFHSEFEYWKPVETGPSDSSKVSTCVPEVVVHPAYCRFTQPVAPPFAARMERGEVPFASELAKQPRLHVADRQLLIESFGSPFSPLNEAELQISLIRALGHAAVLVGPSTLGAIGRSLQCLTALAAEGIRPRAIVLLGEEDSFAVEMIRKHQPGLPVFSLRPPATWTAAGLRQAAAEQAFVLTRLRDCFPKPTPPGDVVLSLQERDRRSVWHPYSPLRAEAPLVCTGAQDEFLFLENGQRVIDGISSWWTILHGHRHPPLMAALRQGMERFDHVLFAGVTHEPAVELAELLLASVWPGEPGSNVSPGRVFYSDDGSTAVEVALKMAYQFWCHHGRPERKRFIGFEHGYHGDTFGAMAVSRDPLFFGRFEPMFLQADIVPLDPNRLDDHLQKHAHETAGVILEPLVQGAGGMVMHGPALLRQIFEVTRVHDVLFIADEVMTGGGRTGTLWAHHQAGIAPDLICAGKTLTGGVLPLAATLVSPRIVEAFDSEDRARTFFHGHSFTAHPLACTVAAANWSLLLANTDTRAVEMEAFWRQALAPLSELPQVCEVRMCGSIAAVAMAEQAGGYLAEIGPRMRRFCLEDGVLLRPLGPVLYAMPPLGTGRASLEKIAAAMMRAATS